MSNVAQNSATRPSRAKMKSRPAKGQWRDPALAARVNELLPIERIDIGRPAPQTVEAATVLARHIAVNELARHIDPKRPRAASAARLAEDLLLAFFRAERDTLPDLRRIATDLRSANGLGEPVDADWDIALMLGVRLGPRVREEGVLVPEAVRKAFPLAFAEALMGRQRHANLDAETHDAAAEE